ncbi:helicase-related protein, partial [Vagococcus teuberi]
KELGIKVKYLHSDIKTLERTEIIRDLRLGEFDVLIGINLLREGLDVPEVSLVAILDADKEGFLRSERSLIQTIGRAARNADGKVIMYADKITDSMERAISETSRRRTIQEEYNAEHGIVPKTIKKDIRDLIRITKESEDESVEVVSIKDQYNAMDSEGKEAVLLDIELQMKDAAKALDFEKAATLRDTLLELKAGK